MSRKAAKKQRKQEKAESRGGAKSRGENGVRSVHEFFSALIFSSLRLCGFARDPLLSSFLDPGSTAQCVSGL
jgi:hypothetical protein